MFVRSLLEMSSPNRLEVLKIEKKGILKGKQQNAVEKSKRYTDILLFVRLCLHPVFHSLKLKVDE